MIVLLSLYYRHPTEYDEAIEKKGLHNSSRAAVAAFPMCQLWHSQCTCTCTILVHRAVALEEAMRNFIGQLSVFSLVLREILMRKVSVVFAMRYYRIG